MIALFRAGVGGPRAEAWIALGFLALATVLRAPGFPRSVIDWDESLYFLMAEAWRHGHLPYLALWDNKPLGIYAVFLLAIAVFGDHVVAIRIAAILAVATTAFLLHRLLGRLTDDGRGRWPGLLAGTLYILGAASDGGMAANTELFMAPPVLAALLLALAPRIGLGRAGAIGLLLGGAAMIKYVIIGESLVPFALLLAAEAPGTRRPGLGYGMGRVGIFGLCAALPFAAAALPYLVVGHLDAFLTASLLANLKRAALPFSTATLSAALRVQWGLWGPLYLVPALLVCFIARRRPEDRRALLLFGWFLGAGFGVVAAKSFYGHYFLEVLPVLSAGAAWLLAEAGISGVQRAVIGLVLVGWPGWSAAESVALTLQPVDWAVPGLLKDRPAALAALLRPVLHATPGAGLYVFDYEPILYSLTGTAPPTRYAFPSFMISRFLSGVAGIDPLREFAAIMAKRPLFVIRSKLRHPTARHDDMALYAAFDRAMARDYTPWREDDEAIIYRRREP